MCTRVCHNMQVEVWGQAVGVSCHLLPCESQGLNSDHWALERMRQHLRHDYFLSTCCVWRALFWLSKILQWTKTATKNNQSHSCISKCPTLGHFYTILVRLLYPMSKYLTETTERAKGLFGCSFSVWYNMTAKGVCCRAVGKPLAFLFFFFLQGPQPME